MAGKHILIKGRVQGVGFRYYTKLQADKIGLRGWVRNLEDGRVETVAVGDEISLDSFILRLKKGPARSKVDECNVEDLKTLPQDLGEEFEIR
jgi:acylphosphatase